jgi:3-oxoadipate enol-lactonase
VLPSLGPNRVPGCPAPDTMADALVTLLLSRRMTAGRPPIIGSVMRIHEAGDPQGRALVLLHGLASSSRCWERTLAAVPERRIVLVDLFAAGGHRFSLADDADELNRELRARGVHRADVVGHSMGGLVALHAAMAQPSIASRMVLVGVPAFPSPGNHLARIWDVARSSLSSRASAVGLVVGSLLRTSPLCVLAATRATIAADAASQVAAVGVSSLLIWGAADRIVPVSVGERLLREMPAAELVVIPGAGHQPQWEQPAAFNAVLSAFLSR